MLIQRGILSLGFLSQIFDISFKLLTNLLIKVKNMIVVISPAKKLDFETSAPTKKFTNLKNISMSEALIKDLKKCSREEISRIMKLSDDLTKLNIKRYKNFKTPNKSSSYN